MTKTAVVILSDPNSGTDESMGRLFNALMTAYDAKQRGDEVTVLFQGAGTRWASLLVDSKHPANGLYEAVKDKIAGVSTGCAVNFGASESAEESGFRMIKENMVPGTPGVPSIAGRVAEGYNVLTF